jgi:hypothetical protein
MQKVSAGAADNTHTHTSNLVKWPHAGPVVGHLILRSDVDEGAIFDMLPIMLGSSAGRTFNHLM